MIWTLITIVWISGSPFKQLETYQSREECYFAKEIWIKETTVDKIHLESYCVPPLPKIIEIEESRK